MNFEIKKPQDANQIDGFVLGVVNLMRYSDPNVLYPKTKKVKPGDGVQAEWFYPALEGSLGAPSEQSAVYQYIKHSAMYPSLGQLCLGIAITEMKHLDKIGDLILSLGGTIETHWNNSEIDYGVSVETALQADIEAEKTTIKFYSGLMEKLSGIDTVTGKICTEMLAKLIADEKVHLAEFEKALAEVSPAGK